MSFTPEQCAAWAMLICQHLEHLQNSSRRRITTTYWHDTEEIRQALDLTKEQFEAGVAWAKEAGWLLSRDVSNQIQ
jgi:hypothetical protein